MLITHYEETSLAKLLQKSIEKIRNLDDVMGQGSNKIVKVDKM